MLKKKSYYFFLFGLVFYLYVDTLIGDDVVTLFWDINNTDQIGGHNTTMLGSPIIIDTEQGRAVEFDGLGDGLIVDANPVAGAEAFTIEVIFKPYASNSSHNIEQRFIHMQESNERRLLIELRLTDDNQWFLDTFIKDGTSSRALYAEDFPHTIGDWYHAALVYENGLMTHFINGQKELSGQVNYHPMQTGQTSIGVRLNQKSWYKGTIATIKITHGALEPEEFIPLHTNVTTIPNNTSEFQLMQNFSNPFNGSTRIGYTILKSAYVSLTVFNIRGHRVLTFLDSFQDAGHYEMNMDLSCLYNGLYFLKLHSGSTLKITKMILIK